MKLQVCPECGVYTTKPDHECEPLWAIGFMEGGVIQYAAQSRGSSQWDALDCFCEDAELGDSADGHWWIYRKSDPSRVYKMQVSSMCEWSYDVGRLEDIEGPLEMEGE